MLIKPEVKGKNNDNVKGKLFEENIFGRRKDEIEKVKEKQNYKPGSNILEKDKDELNKRDYLGSTPLIKSIQEDKNYNAKILLDNGADVNFYDLMGNSPLIWAISKSNIPMIDLLIKKGADVNYKGSFGKTALDIAKEKKHLEIIELLEKAGAK